MTSRTLPPSWQVARTAKMGWCILLLCAWCGCGGGGSGDGGDVTGLRNMEDPVPEAGQVSLANRTSYDMESAYLHVDETGERIFRRDIAVGATVSISDGELSPGVEVESDLVFQVPSSEGLRVRRKATVVVDGDITLVAELTEEGEPFSLALSVAD
ncbi:MAG: hypothetical protein QGG05_05700 [Candidatus Latescibacteria bacterium]|nr:hypothetical protein [Candidatus Latescibacterota bacterium]